MAPTFSQGLKPETMAAMQEKVSVFTIAVKRKPLNFAAASILSVLLIFYVQHARNQAFHIRSPLGISLPMQSSPYNSKGPLLPNFGSPGTVIASPGREIDVSDSFSDWVRYKDQCFLSSLDLHIPFSPLCSSKQSLLDAMTGGGRPGVDMPYEPRSCDMRWFNTEEVCDIVSRFDRIWIVGDSMMRNLAVALHVFLRADLYEGPRAQWAQEPEGLDCHCKGPFETAACMWYVAFSSESVWEHVPAGLPHSIKCPKEEVAMVEYVPQTAYPLDDGVHGLADKLPKEKPTKPHAFVLGHGIWNSLNETATGLWLDQVEGAINGSDAWLTQDGELYPRLFITPNAAGDNKPVQYQETQGNVALHRFEVDMGPYLRGRGLDHLGLYNATIQNTTPDGTHAGMRANLLKAMFVLNWLSFIDTSKH